MDAGFFEREGLNVELVYSGNDDQVFATVLSGAAQFGVGDPAFTAISREKGGEGKVIAALVGRVANWGVTKEPSIQPFTDPKRLNGLRVTSFPSPSTTYTILSSLKKDLSLDKMDIKQIAFGSEQAALERGDADLGIMLEPQASIAESQGFRVVWSVAKDYGDFELTGVTVTDSYIQKDPETIQHFVNAIQMALTFCAKNPEAAAVILENNFPTLPPSIVQSAMKRMVNDQTIPPTAIIEKDAWLKTLEIRKTIGDLKSLDIADSCLDSSFAQKAMHPSYIPTNNPTPEKAPGNQPADVTEHLWDKLWDDLDKVAITLTIIQFLAFVLAIYYVLSTRNAWNKLSFDDRKSGVIIKRLFPNKMASINKRDLWRVFKRQKE